MEKKVYGLTGPQQNIWNTELFFNDSNVNNVCGSAIINEIIDFDIFKQALNIFVKSNDATRTRITMVDNKPVQFFADYEPFDVDIVEASSKSELAQIEQKIVNKRFNILNSNLFEPTVIKFADGTAGLIINSHHITSDSWTLGLAVKEILKIYHSLKNNSELDLKTFSYTEYIDSEKTYKNSKKFLSDKEFWSEYLSSLSEPVSIPGSVISVSSSKGNRLSYNLDKNICNLINTYCKANNISSYVFFMSVFALYIANITDRLDFVLGTPIFNRTNFKEKNSIGMFVETIPFRFKIDPKTSFKDFISKTGLNLMSILRHQKYSYTDILEDLRQVNNEIPNLYNIAISYQITKAYSKDAGDYETKWVFNNNCLNDINIHIYDINDTGSLRIDYDYLVSKYSEEEIDIIHKRVLHMIEQILYNAKDENSTNASNKSLTDNKLNTSTYEVADFSDIRLSDISVITKEEHNKLNSFNTFTLDYPKVSVDKLISATAMHYPDGIAVVHNEDKITYAELENRSNIIANKLISSGITNNDIVCIFMPEKNIDLICSIVGVLKTGAAFLGIYSEYPIDRIKYMIEDSGSRHLITDNFSNANIQKLQKEVPNINYIETSSLDFSIKTNLTKVTDIDINSNAYIIYTSGSTGKPKGVSLSHKNLVNFVYSFNKHLNGVSNLDRFLSVTNICFDVSISEIFTPLVFGATLYLYKDLNYSTPEEIAKYIADNSITFSYFPPAILAYVCEELGKCENVKLNKLLVGVEPIKASTLAGFLKINPNMTIVNGYGPTEATICCTMYDFKNQIPADEVVPIGVPLHNDQIHILNKFMNYLPIGTPGILWVSGDGVGNGYIGKAKNTNNSYRVINNTHLYNTGDLVKWDENGILHFIGRQDNQIKFHGYRIDLGEIEVAIRKYENINNCLVLLNKNDNTDNLIAFVCSSKDINEFDIRTFISNILPHYMIPNIFIFLPTFPLTPNGKIDKKALLEISNSKLKDSHTYAPPTTTLEKTLADIFSKILGVNNISTNDNFFEFGGDSLSAIKLISEIEIKLNAKILIKDIFSFPTVASLAKFIERTENSMENTDASNAECTALSNTSSDNKESANSQYRNVKVCSNDIVQRTSNAFVSHTIQKAPKADAYPLSFAQKRIYYTVKLNEHQTVYNTPFGIAFDKMPDTKKLEECFNTLMQMHQALRTYFTIENGEVVQKVLDKIDFKLEVVETKNDKIDEIFDDFIKPFDLSRAPLFRAKFIKSKNIYVLLIDMHHIICDGRSSSIFADELCKLYNGENIPKEDLDYIDFTCWENKFSTTSEFNQLKDFWLNSFEGDLPVLNMPLQKARPKTQSFKGNKLYAKIENTVKMSELCKKLNVTPYMFLLALYYVLLYKYTNQNDIIVGSPIVGRDNVQTSNIIGMFVNTLPLRAKIDSNSSFKNFLENVKDNCLLAFENQLYPFDELVKNLDIPRDSSTTPIFSTMFTYQNAGTPPLNLGDFKTKYYIPDNNTSKFDFSLEISPEENCLSISLEYCTDLFDKDFMQDFLNHYINVYNFVINENLDTLIKNISILSSTEKYSLLNEYNDTYLDYAKDKTYTELFEEQVKKTPNKKAVIFGDTYLTYEELNKKANQIANYLRNHNVKPNDIVGIMCNRSLELLTCMIGVLKAGAAYLPIDPTYPKDRIDYIIHNSNIDVLLTLDSVKNSIPDLTNYTIVDFDKSDIYTLPSENLKVINSPTDLAYVIYTSGSTGKPKGVMLTHKNVNNFIEATCNVIHFEDVIVSVTTFCFDIFVLESLLPLQKGLTIVMANEEEQNIPQKLNELCLKNNVKMLQTTPARMSLLLSDTSSYEYIKKLKVIMLGGEAFPLNLLKELQALTSAKIYNMYGPTETTVWSSIKDLTNAHKITIGKPIGNTQFYVLDKDMNLVSPGIEGNLFIGGDGVSKGYLHREELTKEKFIPNPFKENDIIYDTGDIAKWNYDKEMVCLGRSDFQVKLRGLRIELSEIENRILQFPNVDKAVVCVRKDTLGRDFLCAYFVSNSRIRIPELKDFLSKFLPQYMVPNKFRQLPDFKYTPNGKIDKKALPEIDLHTNENCIVLASTPTEKKLAKIFEEILGISPISINDNFFEIGGDSMSALKLQIKLLNDNINITYSDIFKYNTIKQLAKKIDRKINSKTTNLEKYDFSKIDKLLSVNNTDSLNDITKKEPGNIILTGATGFLGAHILSYILDNTNLKVYCLLRPDLSIDINTKLMKRLNYYFGDKYMNLLNSRVFAISSDISSVGLGLDIDTINLLNNNATCVINSAAIVKHYGNYSDFERVNVFGVKNLVRFCTKYHKKFVQISTISVSGNTLFDLAINKSNFTEDVEFNETNLYIGQSLENVYVRSKFEAEKIVLENIIYNGLDGLILRIGNITNRSTDGKFQPNSSENAFANRLKAFLELKCVPNYLKNIYAEFSPVDNVAEAVYKSICYANNINVLHVYNSNHLQMSDLVDFLPNDKLKFVNDDVFDKELREFMNSSDRSNPISYLVNDLDKEKHLNYNNTIKIKNDFTNKFFDKINFKWSAIDKDYIFKLINNI